MQAPQQRSAPRTPGERRTVVYLVSFGAAGVLLLGAVLALLAFGGDDGGGTKSGISSKYCSEESQRGLPPRHLSNPDAKVDYNSFPPSSGPHYQEWAPWGWYDDSIKQTILVHNLEHGGVVIQYGPGVSKEDVRKLQSFFNDDPNALVVAPYARLEKRFVLTAWNAPEYPRDESDLSDVDAGKGYVLTCTRFDEEAFSAFRQKRRGKAGERLPVSDLVPGTQ